MSEIAVVRVESAIAAVLALIVSGQAIYVFVRAERRFATYAALMNLSLCAVAGILAYTAWTMDRYVQSWPDTAETHALRILLIVSSLVTAGFLRSFRGGSL